MATPARKIEIRRANEALILETAEREFALNGFKGASIAHIAREAGLPKANLHYYFKTKMDLYQQVLKLILDEWMEAASTFQDDADPEQALRTYIHAKMAFSRNRPYGSRVWAREVMSGAPIMESFLGTILKSWVDERARIIHGWVRDGKIDPIHPRTMLYMIWATTQHYADFERQMVILNGGRKISNQQFKQRTDQVTDLLLTSIGCQAKK
jgi:TetR/AcrR family transcriptional regulator